MSYKQGRSEKAQNAMLTDKQREMLQNGGQGLTKQTQRDHHKQIKNRVYNTILDFELLLENWTEDNRNEVFEDLMDENGSIEPLVDVFAFLYSAASQSGAFKDALTKGVRKAEYRKSTEGYPNVTQVDFSVESKPKAGFPAVEKYLEGPERIKDMSNSEAMFLIFAMHYDDQLSDDSVKQAVDTYQRMIDNRPSAALEELLEDSDM